MVKINAKRAYARPIILYAPDIDVAGTWSRMMRDAGYATSERYT